MGGTSTDVALIQAACRRCPRSSTSNTAMPIHVPMVDVHTVGAGGGSHRPCRCVRHAARRAGIGGRAPGPICYGRGGTRPTITDANLLLGRLDPDSCSRWPVGGGCDMVRVADAFETVGRPLGLSVEDAAAAAILRIANTHMAGAIRMVSLSRGHDPRDFVLFAFGGAGPLHAVGTRARARHPRGAGARAARPHQRAGLRRRRPAARLRANRQQAAARARHGPRRRRAAGAARGRRAHQRAGEGRGGRDASSCTAPTCSSRGRRISSASSLPRTGRDPRRRCRAIFEDAYFARFRVRLPEIRPVLVNLVTSVIGKRAPFPVTALVTPRPGAATKGGRKLYLGDPGARPP